MYIIKCVEVRIYRMEREMKTDKSRIMLFTQKYSILFIVVIFSICVGYISYNISVGVDMNFDNGSYAANLEQNSNVSEISLHDIISSNNVVKERVIVEEEEIPFSVVSIGNSRSGTGTVISEGKTGIKQILYKSTYINDELEQQKEISSAITVKPASKVVSYASQNYTASRGDVTYRDEENANIPVASYTKVIKMRYTAYCLCKKCCGKNPDHPAYGVTASGYKITPGINEKIVAVDPSIVKLGSTVYVQNLSGKADYGYALAADTGGAIKQNRIDLYIDSHQEALQVGTGYCNVYVLD